MTRKAARKSRKEPTPKQEGEQIVEAAAKAGADYAHEQVGSREFSDWVRDQMVEAEASRKRDPSSVIPLESPADFRKLARNMLQQLEWDTKRQLDSREILELSGASGAFSIGSADWTSDHYGITLQDVTGAFFGAFKDTLTRTSTVEWLTDEVMRTHEEMAGAPTGHAHREPAARATEARRPSRVAASDDMLIAVRLDDPRFGGGPATIVSYPESVADYRKKFSDRDGAMDPRMRLWSTRDRLPIGSRVSAGLVPGTGTAKLHPETSHQAVKDYVAVDTRNRVVAGPFKDYGQAKREADRAGGHVRFVMDRGPHRQVREDPRDLGYDPDSKAGLRNFPRLRRMGPNHGATGSTRRSSRR